jgi:hypothetical protein
MIAQVTMTESSTRLEIETEQTNPQLVAVRPSSVDDLQISGFAALGDVEPTLAATPDYLLAAEVVDKHMDHMLIHYASAMVVARLIVDCDHYVIQQLHFEWMELPIVVVA